MEENVQPIKKAYELILQPDGKNYKFITDDHAVYDVKFDDASCLFEGASFEEHAEMLSLLPERDTEPSKKEDLRIGATMAEVLRRAFIRDKRLVLSFICSPKDKQQYPRFRKFNGMFAKYNKSGTYKNIKIDEAQTYGGVIFQSSNSAAEDVVEAVKFLL